jgi:hypothetical protein
MALINEFQVLPGYICSSKHVIGVVAYICRGIFVELLSVRAFE